ncbi:hypothetical protein LTS08_007581 [Lithohypha guttulata]|nr:hypothetical protein LTS08_007581 [Lithohypha guttulata]
MVEATLITRSVSNHYATATQKNTFNGQYSPDSVIVTLSIAISLFNSLELILLIFSTFKRWRGLYFWSLTICNLGVMLYAVGMMLSYFELSVRWLWKVILDVGWTLMVSFQSLVLYSRLGLIVSNEKILAAVKWMIIVNSICLCTIVNIFDFGSTYSGSMAFSEGYYYIERIQMTLFTIQELIISGLYVYTTLALLKVISKENTRSMIWQLLTINVIIISMDIGLVTLQFLHFQLYQEAIKVFVYSVKLKLELNILSKLVDLVHGNSAQKSMSIGVIDATSIPGTVQSDVHQEMSQGGVFGSADSRMALEKKEEIHRHGSRYSDASAQQISATSNDMYPVLSNSRYSSRTSGRETDIIYADILRDIK